MNVVETRQILSGTLLVLDLLLGTLLALYLWDQLRREGWARARADIVNQAAFGLLAVMVGHAVIRGWTSYLLWLQAHGFPSWELELTYPVAFLGLLIAVVGKLCVIRVFSRDSWGHWGWLGGLAAAALITTLLVVT